MFHGIRGGCHSSRTLAVNLTWDYARMMGQREMFRLDWDVPKPLRNIIL